MQTVPIPEISSVGQVLSGRDDELLFLSSTYLKPPAWYRFDPRTGKATQTALFRISPADFSDCEVVRETATSKDGTKVPMSILRKKGTKLDGKITARYLFGAPMSRRPVKWKYTKTPLWSAPANIRDRFDPAGFTFLGYGSGIGCLDCKAVLLEHMVPPLAKIREARERFAAKPREIVEILHEGSRRARVFAQKTMEEVRSVISLEPR